MGYVMECVFFGHRKIFYNDLRVKLYAVVEDLINKGITNFKMGVHGAFDKMALSVCEELREKYKHINICVVFTSLNDLKQDPMGYSKVDLYKNVDTMFYGVEDIYFKKQITETNKRMIDDSDIVVCYYDKVSRSNGTKLAVKYALKKNKEIIYLYDTLP